MIELEKKDICYRSPMKLRDYLTLVLYIPYIKYYDSYNKNLLMAMPSVY